MNLAKHLKITVLRIVGKYENMIHALIKKQFVNIFPKNIIQLVLLKKEVYRL